MTAVYALADATGSVRYIGITTQALNQRLSRHASGALKSDTAVSRWIRSLPERPSIHAMLHVEPHEASAAEQQFIAAFRAAGHDLVNSTIGGCGAPGRIKSPDEIARHAAKLRGRTHSPEARQRISEGHRGLKRSEETKTKMRAAWERRHAEGRALMTPETKAKLSSSLSAVRAGRPKSEAWKASMRASHARRRAEKET